MKIFVYPRQGGKTTAVFEAMKADDNLHYTASTEHRTEQAFQQSIRNGYNFPRWRFHSCAELMGPKAFQRGRLGNWPSTYEDMKLAIDELDDFLYGLFGVPVTIATNSHTTLSQERITMTTYDEDGVPT